MRLARPLTLAASAVVLACLAGAAWADPPDPNFSQVDPIGVGDNTGTAVGGANPGFDVDVRDDNNAPVLHGIVVLDFSGTGVRAYATQNSGTTVDAIDHLLSRTAVVASVKFAARTSGFANAPLVHVSADGIPLRVVAWRSTDVDGLDGKTGLGDFAYFAGRFLAGTSAPELNFDLSGTDVPGLGDFTIFSSQYLAAGTGAYAW